MSVQDLSTHNWRPWNVSTNLKKQEQCAVSWVPSKMICLWAKTAMCCSSDQESETQTKDSTSSGHNRQSTATAELPRQSPTRAFSLSPWGIPTIKGHTRSTHLHSLAYDAWSETIQRAYDWAIASCLLRSCKGWCIQNSAIRVFPATFRIGTSWLYLKCSLKGASQRHVYVCVHAPVGGRWWGHVVSGLGPCVHQYRIRYVQWMSVGTCELV